MSISGKMSMGMRKAAPMPIKVIRISKAATVYGRFSAVSTTDMRVLWAQVSFGTRLFSGQQSKFGARIGVQFLHDAAHVVLHGAFGEKQRIGDLSIGHALGDELENFL